MLNVSVEGVTLVDRTAATGLTATADQDRYRFRRTGVLFDLSGRNDAGIPSTAADSCRPYQDLRDGNTSDNMGVPYL